jgi:hypothetical protein
MLKEAISAGLIVDVSKMDVVMGKSAGSYALPDPNAKLHESLTWAWRPAELIWKRHFNWQRKQWEKRMNLGRRRTIPPGSQIHQSAYKRAGGYAKRLPSDAIPVP